MENPIFQRETQQKINRLLRFFTREDASGFIFAVADDQRAISSINRTLVDLGGQKGKKIALLFLSNKNEIPLLEQFRRAANSDAVGIIIGNLDSIFPKNDPFDPKKPLQDLLNELNFGREALHRLEKPLLFWVSPDNFARLQQQAADLFTQRASSTLFFDIKAYEEPSMGLEIPAAEQRTAMLDEESEQMAHDRVTLLLRQLDKAQKSNQARSRTAVDIVLPLAEELAKLDDSEAIELLNEYELDFDAADTDSLARRGETYLKLHNFEKAEPLLGQAKVLLEKQSPDANLSSVLVDLGDLWVTTGKIEEAFSIFEQNWALSNRLLEEQPDSQFLKNRLALACERLGITHTALGNLDKALQFYENYNRLAKELHDAYPNHVEFKNGLAVSYQCLGITHTALGDLDKALQFYENYNRLEKELHDAYPNHVEFKNLLAISYQCLGETHTALGDLDKALQFYENYNRLAKELHDAYPNHVAFKKGLATSYLHLGQFHRDRKKEASAAQPYLQKGYDLYTDLVRDFPNHPSFRGNYEWAKKALGIE